MNDRIYMTESVERYLAEASSASLPLETGGLLLGLIRNDIPWVTRMVEVLWDERTSSRMMIPAGTAPRVVKLVRKGDDRLGYLGTWHTHPENVGLSPTDLSSLERDGLRRGRRRKMPALSVLVRQGPEGWIIEAARNAGSGAFPARITLTGEPPEQNAEGTQERGDD